MTVGFKEDPKPKDELKYVDVFAKYARVGLKGLNEQERATMEQKYQAAQTTTNSEGGYTIPQEWADMVYKFMALLWTICNGR